MAEVYSCAGDVDLVVIVRVTAHEELAEVIAGRLSKIDGVHRTDTHIAFRSYAKADTDATFSSGSPATGRIAVAAPRRRRLFVAGRSRACEERAKAVCGEAPSRFAVAPTAQ